MGDPYMILVGVWVLVGWSCTKNSNMEYVCPNMLYRMLRSDGCSGGNLPVAVLLDG